MLELISFLIFWGLIVFFIFAIVGYYARNKKVNAVY